MSIVKYLMYENFTSHRIKTKSADIFLRTGGSGEPLLMLHGYPQTHHAWHLVAPELAKHYQLIIPDLRGYGESLGPLSDQTHLAYSKREMAQDVLEVMRSLGHQSFHVVGHDRGGRVAYRLALDSPDAVRTLCVVDIIPTIEAIERVNARVALKMYHWFFLAQPSPIPEELILKNSEAYIRHFIESWVGSSGGISEQAMARYTDSFSNPSVVHAACEDYRAGITCDAEHDAVDRQVDRRIDCPTLVLWGEQYAGEKANDPLAVWRTWARNVRTACLPCGHFPAEELPSLFTEMLLGFLQESKPSFERTHNGGAQ
jgi:haloacetate dehalogenase